MRVLSNISALLALSSFAVADLATVSGVLSAITTDLGKLTAAVGKFNGQPIDAVPILDQAKVVLDDITSGSQKVQTTEVLGLIDTIGILIPLFSLDSAVGTTINALIQKKPQFKEAFVDYVVSDQLGLFNTAANQLVKDIVAKLPAYLPTFIAQIFYQGILTNLEKGVKEFSDGAPDTPAPTASATPKATAAPKATAVPNASAPKSPNGSKSTAPKDGKTAAIAADHAHGRRIVFAA